MVSLGKHIAPCLGDEGKFRKNLVSFPPGLTYREGSDRMLLRHTEYEAILTRWYKKRTHNEYRPMRNVKTYTATLLYLTTDASYFPFAGMTYKPSMWK